MPVIIIKFKHFTCVHTEVSLLQILLIPRRLCIDHEGVRPDIVILGKALSGGFYPVSLNEHILL